MARRVLCLSNDPELALLRCEVLRTRGMEVDYPRSQSEASAFLESYKYDVLLICHSVPTHSATLLRSHFLAANTNGCVVYVARSSSELAPISSDIRIVGLDGPCFLLPIASPCSHP
jgi:DNA-binding response OmpR family regulator